jgi:hypothetical protein
MNRGLATLVFGCAVALSAAVSVAQQMQPSPQRERLCALEAHRRGLKGGAYTAYMDRCVRLPPKTGTGTGGPAVPPAQPPTATPPAQPPGGRPQSPREISCHKMVLELGITGAAAQAYLDRCLKAH